jgi:DNA polymerase-3 subunit alpha
MKFGTFLDAEGNFFDTVHFCPITKKYPLYSAGPQVGKTIEIISTA